MNPRNRLTHVLPPMRHDPNNALRHHGDGNKFGFEAAGSKKLSAINFSSQSLLASNRAYGLHPSEDKIAVEISVRVQASRFEVIIRSGDSFDLFGNFKKRTRCRVNVIKQSPDGSHPQVGAFVCPVPVAKKFALASFHLLDEFRHVFGTSNLLQRSMGRLACAKVQRTTCSRQSADKTGDGVWKG